VAIKMGKSAPRVLSSLIAELSITLANRQKKTEVALCLFYSSLSGVQTGIPSGPSGGIPSPSVGSELRLCRPFATLFYLSTLPPASPSLPSAVGHSSVAVGIGNITKRRAAVNTFFEKNVEKQNSAIRPLMLVYLKCPTQIS
jgi:hypothetical protein